MFVRVPRPAAALIHRRDEDVPIRAGRDLHVTDEAIHDRDRCRPRRPAVVRPDHLQRTTTDSEVVPTDVRTPIERARRVVIDPTRLTIIAAAAMRTRARRPRDPIRRRPHTDPLTPTARSQKDRDPLRMQRVKHHNRIAETSPMTRTERPRVQIRPRRAAIRRIRTTLITARRRPRIVIRRHNRVPSSPHLRLRLRHMRGSPLTARDQIDVRPPIIIAGPETSEPATKNSHPAATGSQAHAHTQPKSPPHANSSASQADTYRSSRRPHARTYPHSHPPPPRPSARSQTQRTRPTTANAHAVASAQTNLPYPCAFRAPQVRSLGAGSTTLSASFQIFPKKEGRPEGRPSSCSVSVCLAPTDRQLHREVPALDRAGPR